MKEQLQLLYELQQIDTQIQADETELAELDDGSSAEQALAQEEQLYQQMQQDLAATQAQLHDKELQWHGTEDDRESKWAQAYGGRVSDPKELQALEQKIAELDRRKDQLEEETLRLMDDVETKQQAVADNEAQVHQLREKLQSIQQNYRTRTEQLVAELTGLRQRREQLPQQISPSLLQQYEQLHQRSNNLAVVAVVNGACSGCHTSVPSNYVTRLENPTEVLKCESCRRILVIPD